MREVPQEAGTMIFGLRAIIEAILAGKEIDRLLLDREMGQSELTRQLLQVAREHQVPVQKVPKFKLDKITRKNHQGAICFVSEVSYASLDHVISQAFTEGKNPLILILDRITDVRNLGAIARSAECAGVDALVIPTQNTAQINSDAIKTSAGALHHIAVCREKSLLQAVRFLQESGLQVVACTEHAAEYLYSSDLRQPTAIIMGSEDEGIASELLKKADYLAKIPMYGKISSLNVSVAAGIVLYEAVRQRF